MKRNYSISEVFRCIAFTLILPASAALAADITIDNQSYVSGQAVTVLSDGAITTTTAVTVNSGADVKFIATTRVTLSAGFRATSGSAFRAFAGDTDGDGMPDSWETANGLSPLVNDAQLDPDNDGVSNLMEFYLGTNPHVGNSTDTTNQAQLKVHKPTP